MDDLNPQDPIDHSLQTKLALLERDLFTLEYCRTGKVRQPSTKNDGHVQHGPTHPKPGPGPGPAGSGPGPDSSSGSTNHQATSRRLPTRSKQSSDHRSSRDTSTKQRGPDHESDLSDSFSDMNLQPTSSSPRSSRITDLESEISRLSTDNQGLEAENKRMREPKRDSGTSTAWTKEHGQVNLPPPPPNPPPHSSSSYTSTNSSVVSLDQPPSHTTTTAAAHVLPVAVPAPGPTYGPSQTHPYQQQPTYQHQPPHTGPQPYPQNQQPHPQHQSSYAPTPFPAQDGNAYAAGYAHGSRAAPGAGAGLGPSAKSGRFANPGGEADEREADREKGREDRKQRKEDKRKEEEHEGHRKAIKRSMNVLGGMV